MNSAQHGQHTEDKRAKISGAIASAVLTKAHYRCAICPEHRRVADLHHIDLDSSNSVESNLIGVCKECHADIHESSAMRRKIAHGDLKIFKGKWEEKCASLSALMHNKIVPHQWVYAHLHRLDPLYKLLTNDNIYRALPYQFKSDGKCLNTLWHNKLSSLAYFEHNELRSHIDNILNNIVNNMNAIDLHVIESESIQINEVIGSYIFFSAEFSGKDIPYQDEFIKNFGNLEGPPGTLRREIFLGDFKDTIIETCLTLEPRYYYSDSAFIQLGETGNWAGIGLLNATRNVASNDGHCLRTQLIITPLCIASTAYPHSSHNGGYNF